ncbi:flagellar export chaperone FlgN [Clostridium sp. D2Q-11]|uniref:Flagellar export chaperone FlgN n=1 Tax=Anaeromonas frigoriresistens TaxID=2683708 RepID=A0A942Z8L7_9FIRM|nr:flagellar export chaperone FlgN [Anaeromonas frigoriresistens]MBS4538134.1 flagellar export chaperone FlgN [Anaeromonas frigoriresistens]
MEEINKLVQLLDNKNILLDDFYRLTLAQKKLIEDTDMEKLNRLVNNKEKIIQNIDKLDAEFVEKFNEVKNKYGITDLTELNVERIYLLRLQEVTKKCNDKMMEIAELDKKNSENMKSKFDNVKTKLREIKRGKTTTNKYYNKSASTGGYFIDSKK